jgi:ElaB/YqjD/DUF883 family membrane-anchored ribosome-binding protein
MKSNFDKTPRTLKDEAEQLSQNLSQGSSNGNGSKPDISHEAELQTLRDDFAALKNAFNDLSMDLRSTSTNMVGDAASNVAKTVNDNATSISEAISNRAGKISDTATEVAHNVSAKVSQAAGNVAATVSDAGSTLGRHATDMSHQAANSAKSVSAELEAFTQRSPTLALACAVGVGMLLGNIARPSR